MQTSYKRFDVEKATLSSTHPAQLLLDGDRIYRKGEWKGEENPRAIGSLPISLLRLLNFLCSFSTFVSYFSPSSLSHNLRTFLFSFSYGPLMCLLLKYKIELLLLQRCLLIYIKYFQSGIIFCLEMFLNIEGFKNDRRERERVASLIKFFLRGIL